MFPPVVQATFDNFFEQDYTFTLIGICKNVNSIVDKDSYFVSKVKIDDQHEVFFRLSETSIDLILDRVLGRANRAFSLDKLTELETRIITAFVYKMFRSVSNFLSPVPPTITRTNFNVVYLVFLVTDNSVGQSGRLVITIPEVLIAPAAIDERENFPISQFETSPVKVRLDVGRTIFSLYDLKNLEVDDMIVFESSNTERMKLTLWDYEKEVILKPNLGLVVPIDENGGSEVAEKDVNIWDSIEVEMVAYFDGVDITLGELKKIQAGMVVDLTSIYQNRVTLTVEDKPIASGELVIVNDKYGVKITEVYAPKVVEAVPNQNQAVNGKAQQGEAVDNADGNIEENNNGEAQDGEEEFDYSDFDLEEDI